jgi:hypothetical protein
MKPKDTPVKFAIPDTVGPGDLDGLTHAIIRAASLGQISPDQARGLASAVMSHVNVVSAADVQKLRDEVAALREMLVGGPTIQANAESVKEDA